MGPPEMAERAEPVVPHHCLSKLWCFQVFQPSISPTVKWEYHPFLFFFSFRCTKRWNSYRGLLEVNEITQELSSLSQHSRWTNVHPFAPPLPRLCLSLPTSCLCTTKGHPSGGFNLLLSTETAYQAHSVCLPRDNSLKLVRSSKEIGRKDHRTVWARQHGRALE